MNNQLPSWLFCLPQVRNVNSTNAREQHLLHIPRTKTDIGSRVLISRMPGNTTIRAGEASIHFGKSVKNLLLHFGNYVSCDAHVTEMSKKVSGTLMYINRIEDLLSKETRLMAVETLALSHINYSITI